MNTGRIWCVRSINAKNGGVVPTFDQSTAVNLGGDIVFSEPINPEGLVGQVFLAVDRSGTSTNDNVYMLASVQPFGFTDGSDVMFVRSTDGGTTFSAPRRVNDDPVNHAKWHWFGTLSVAPNGRIDVVWFDTRNAANNTTHSFFIPTASMAETPGRQMSPSATRLTHSSVIRISLRSAITSQSFRTTPAPTLHMQPHSMARKTSIMSASVQQRQVWATSVLGICSDR